MKKKLVGLLLTCVMVLGSAMTVFAAGSVTYDTVAGNVGTGTATTDTFPTATTVTCSRPESFTVSIPKAITLDGSTANPSQAFDVKIWGDLGSAKQVRVSVPADSTLTQGLKPAVHATTTFNHVWASADIPTAESSTVGKESGTIEIPTTYNSASNGLSAGSWSGTITFQVSCGTAP